MALMGADFYQFLFHQFPDAVLVQNKNGRILESNAAALEMFGFSREEILNLSIKDLVPEEIARTIPVSLDETNTTGQEFVWLSCKKKNGTFFPAQYSSRVVHFSGKKHIITFFRDFSERYFCRYPIDPPEQGYPQYTRDYPNLSLTWEWKDDSFVLIGYDDRAQGTTGRKIGNYLGKKVHDLYKERPDIIHDFERCFKERAVLRRKTLYRMFTTGDERIAELTYIFLHPNMIVMHLEDFTERDTVEALNRSFVRSSSVGLALIQGGRFRFSNPKLREYTGYNDIELAEIEPVTIIHQDDRGVISQVLNENRIVDIPSSPVELRILTKNGETRWMMVTITSLFYLREQAFLLSLVDITELKLAQEKLDELTALRSSIMAAIPHAVIGLDNRRIMFSNHAVETVFGWKPEELLGKTMNLLFHDKKKYIRVARKLYEQLKDKETYSLECTYKKKDGQNVICLTSVSRIGEKEDDRRIVSTYTDITEKKRAEESLRENQRILTTLMGNLPGMAYRCKNDWNWSMEFVSEGSYTLTGYRPSELTENPGISYGDLILQEDRHYVWEKVQDSLKTRERFQMMYRIVTAEGRIKWVWERGLGIFSPRGELIALEGFISDITERKITEEQLRKSRRQLRIHAEHLHVVLEGERAEIAREIHDELGQILTALKMDLFWVGKRVPEDKTELHLKVTSMIAHIDSTIKTVERILMELRPGLLDDLGLTSAIEWQAEEFQRRTGIVCDAILEPDPERLISDTKISTAIFRICQEALTNIARHSHATKVELTLKLNKSAVELTVCDNGKGITRSDIRKVGSFGILGIKERTHLLGGKVAVAGRKDKGTAIRVRIPLHQFHRK